MSKGSVRLQIVVVFMSLGFIGFVTALHIIGKVRLHCLQPCAPQEHYPCRVLADS